MPPLQVLFTAELKPADAEAYDRFVHESPSGHYAQTRAWCPVARAARPCATRFFLARDGARVVGAGLLLRASVAGIALPFAAVDRGPVVHDPGDLPRVLAALRHAAQRRAIARLAVMPYWAGDAAARATTALLEARFKNVQTLDGAHASTLRLEIAGKTDEQIFGKSRDQVPRRIKQAEKAGAIARAGDAADFERHRELSAELFSEQGRGDKSRGWYDALWNAMLVSPERGAFFVCEHEGAIVATVVVLRHKDLAVYAFGATTSARLQFSKTVLALLAAIKWARDVGCTTFDLGGVPLEEDADPKRAAIAATKYYFSKARVSLVREHARWL